MAKRKTSKVFINKRGSVKAFLWADVGADGSVMIGVPAKTKSNLMLIMDAERDYHPQDLYTEEARDSEKISFHSSGQYKMVGKVGKNKGSADRVTVRGPRLADIRAPRRMIDFMLPQEIISKTYRPTDRDIILDAPEEDQPLRVTVFCMSHKEFENLFDTETRELKMRFVSTSICESFHGLESKDHVWVFVLRVSKDDTEFPDRLIIHLAGKPSWGYSWWQRLFFKLTRRMKLRSGAVDGISTRPDKLLK